MRQSSSLPSRERGLKLSNMADWSRAVGVAPFTGAWIEIMTIRSALHALSRSLPSRERGLKFVGLPYRGRPRRSLPSRERGLK